MQNQKGNHETLHTPNRGNLDHCIGPFFMSNHQEVSDGIKIQWRTSIIGPPGNVSRCILVVEAIIVASFAEVVTTRGRAGTG